VLGEVVVLGKDRLADDQILRDRSLGVWGVGGMRTRLIVIMVLMVTIVAVMMIMLLLMMMIRRTMLQILSA
jgi:hypothetical protein